MSDIRDRMVDLATACVRLHDPQPEYLALVAPGESPSTAASMARLSGCGLVVRALLGRLFGVDADPRLAAPYRFGQVMIDLRAMASEADAWHDGESWTHDAGEPEPGDLVLFESPEHIATVVDVLAYSVGAPFTLHTIDGGQRLLGAEAVLRVERQISLNGGRAYVCSPTVRPIAGYIDLDALAAKFGGAT